MISAMSLVERAREQCGLDDLGPDGWQPGLEQLLAAADSDLGLAASRARIEAAALARLTARLRIEKWYAEHGEAARQGVEGPVVILGLPRTATTALHHLLAVDPRFRFPRMWEMGDAAPPPEAANEARDPRRPRGPEAPNRDVRHIATVDGPTEDNPIFGLHFHAQELGWPLPSYTRWWRSADLTSAFAYHERVLRLLHSRRPPHRWLLKAPAYLFNLGRLAEQYPGARFLMTHRDPGVALPSTCSTVLDARARVLPEAPLDATATARELLEHYVIGVERALAARGALGEARFLDLGQRELETDPLGTAGRIYAFLGLELAPEVMRAMQRWAARNRRGSRGEHRYSARQYGLEADAIREAFAPYLERFGAFCE